MPKSTEHTEAQRLFLAAFRQNPAGPPPAAWPAPGTFRRWLKRPAFRRALASIRDALRFQADLHVATAAAQAAKSLQAALPDTDPLDAQSAAHLTTQLKAITDLLRLAHLRQRFPADTDTDAPATHPNPTHTNNSRAPRPRQSEEFNSIARRIDADPTRGERGILNDPQRLKSYLFLVSRDCRDFDPFLLAFADELKAFREAPKHHPQTPSSQPPSSPSLTSSPSPPPPPQP